MRCQASVFCERTDTGEALARFGEAFCQGHAHLLGWRETRNVETVPADAPLRVRADHSWRVGFETDDDDRRIADAAYRGVI